jgi:threonine aldolase
MGKLLAFVPGMTCPKKAHTNTWTVTDACGNISEVYTQVITITDNTAPTWTTTAGALDATLECSDAAGIAAAQALIPVASDNCDGDVTNIIEIHAFAETCRRRQLHQYVDGGPMHVAISGVQHVLRSQKYPADPDDRSSP